MFSDRTQAGKHLILDIKNIKFDYTLNDVVDTVEFICKNYNYKVLNRSIHKFDEHKAFTMLYLLSESHLSIHTFPEKNYISMDIFTCRMLFTEKNFLSITKILKNFFESDVDYKIIDREF